MYGSVNRSARNDNYNTMLIAINIVIYHNLCIVMLVSPLNSYYIMYIGYWTINTYNNNNNNYY